MGGLRYVNGYPDQPPPRTGVSLGDTLTGMFAAQGVLMALYWRDALGGGKGQVVDAAISESCFAMMESALTEYQKLGVIREPSGTGLANVSPSNIFPTSDGKWVVIAANIDAMFRRLCAAMDQPELAENPRYIDHKARGNHAAELDGLIADWTRTLTSEDLTAQLDKHGIVVGPIYTMADIMKDPQFQARGMIRKVEDENLGELAVPGIVPTLTESPGDIAWLGPAEVGQDNFEIYGGMLGYSDDELAELKNDGII